jgi:hypothetical protein
LRPFPPRKLGDLSTKATARWSSIDLETAIQ